MRTALKRNSSIKQQISGGSMPAPVGGWNAKDPQAAMPRFDAVLLDNWIARPGFVEARKGSLDYAIGLPATVQSLLVWRGGGVGNDEIFAASGSAIYDVTDGGIVGAGVVTGLANAMWQGVNFANDAGNWLLCFNGADTPRKYDGSSWTTITLTGTVGPFTIDPTTLDNAFIHKRRVFMSEADSLRVWFTDTDAISGACGLLDLGPVFVEGGTLAGMAAWTRDGGAGPDDFAVFTSTQGQVAVYQGTDPTDPDNWSLVGVFSLSEPLGKRSLIQYGADLVLLTTAGVLPMSQAAVFNRTQEQSVALTAKIQEAFAKASDLYGNNFGWEAFLYPAGQIAIYNVPVTQLGTSLQFVQDMQTGSWSRFRGLNAFCWAYANGRAFFGAANKVIEWDVGSSDNGTAITCDLTGAFKGFGASHQQKQFTMIRPILRAPNSQTIHIDVLTDYRTGAPQNTVTTVEGAPGSMTWGSMVWGSMVWSGGGQGLRLDWTSCTGVGYVGAPRLRTILNPEPSTSGIELESGGGVIALEDDSGDIALETVSYGEVSVQIIGFDIMYQTGGVL